MACMKFDSIFVLPSDLSLERRGDSEPFATLPVHFFKLGLNNSKYGEISTTIAYKGSICTARY